MTLDIMIDEQLLAINAELRKENETLKADIDEIRDDLKFAEKQRDINYKAEQAMREKYEHLKQAFNDQSENYTALVCRIHNMQQEVETLRGMVRISEVLDD